MILRRRIFLRNEPIAAVVNFERIVLIAVAVQTQLVEYVLLLGRRVGRAVCLLIAILRRKTSGVDRNAVEQTAVVQRAFLVILIRRFVFRRIGARFLRFDQGRGIDMLIFVLLEIAADAFIIAMLDARRAVIDLLHILHIELDAALLNRTDAGKILLDRFELFAAGSIVEEVVLIHREGKRDVLLLSGVFCLQRLAANLGILVLTRRRISAVDVRDVPLFPGAFVRDPDPRLGIPQPLLGVRDVFRPIVRLFDSVGLEVGIEIHIADLKRRDLACARQLVVTRCRIGFKILDALRRLIDKVIVVRLFDEPDMTVVDGVRLAVFRLHIGIAVLRPMLVFSFLTVERCCTFIGAVGFDRSLRRIIVYAAKFELREDVAFNGIGVLIAIVDSLRFIRLDEKICFLDGSHISKLRLACIRANRLTDDIVQRRSTCAVGVEIALFIDAIVVIRTIGKRDLIRHLLVFAGILIVKFPLRRPSIAVKKSRRAVLEPVVGELRARSIEELDRLRGIGVRQILILDILVGIRIFVVALCSIRTVVVLHEIRMNGVGKRHAALDVARAGELIRIQLIVPCICARKLEFIRHIIDVLRRIEWIDRRVLPIMLGVRIPRFLLVLRFFDMKFRRIFVFLDDTLVLHIAARRYIRLVIDLAEIRHLLESCRHFFLLDVARRLIGERAVRHARIGEVKVLQRACIEVHLKFDVFVVGSVFRSLAAARQILCVRDGRMLFIDGDLFCAVLDVDTFDEIVPCLMRLVLFRRLTHDILVAVVDLLRMRRLQPDLELIARNLALIDQAIACHRIVRQLTVAIRNRILIQKLDFFIRILISQAIVACVRSRELDAAIGHIRFLLFLCLR